MKTIPQHPYLQNIVAEYHRQHGTPNIFDDNDHLRFNDYIKWLKQFGFRVPMDFHKIEFPDDFPDDELLLFILRWS
jgi:hypothetical protein